MHLPSLQVAAAAAGAEPDDVDDGDDADAVEVDDAPGFVEVALAVCVEPVPGAALLDPEPVPVAFALALPDADPLACIPAFAPDDDVFSGLSVTAAERPTHYYAAMSVVSSGSGSGGSAGVCSRRSASR